MTLLESNQVHACDLLEVEQENSLLSDGKFVRRDPGDILRLQVVSKETVTFCPPPGLRQPAERDAVDRIERHPYTHVQHPEHVPNILQLPRAQSVNYQSTGSNTHSLARMCGIGWAYGCSRFCMLTRSIAYIEGLVQPWVKK